MDPQDVAIVAAGVIAFAVISRRLDGTIVTGPMLFAGFGLLIGGAGLRLADLDFDHGFVHGLAEVTLILVLFTDAARIDLALVRRDHDIPVRLLAIGMPIMIAAGAAVALALPLGLSLWEAALLAAILAPTDAALGQAVVSNPLVPARIRQALNIESGLNDGIALPLVLLFAALAGAAEGVDGRDWLLFGAEQIVLGPIAGLVIGAAGAWAIDRAAIRGWMAESYQGPASLGVALLAFAGAELIGGNGFIATFVSGLVFGNRVRGRCGFLFAFAEAEGELLTLLTFLIFGAAIVPPALAGADWSVLAYALLSLAVLRPASVALALPGAGVRPATIAYLGWFGPRGLASILFALFVLEQVAMAAADRILAVTVVTVALSIVAHGLSAAPAARRYGRAVERLGACAETRPAAEMPTRSGLVAPPGTG